jgi:2'-5' RNA ligase
MPAETGRLLSEIEVPGEAVDFGHAHITVVYLGDDVPLEQVLKAAGVCFEVAQAMRPIKCATRHTQCFPPGDEGKHPIICPIDSPDLHVVKAAIDAGLDAAGVPFSKKWPEYRPHTTLAYADAPCDTIQFDPIEWTAFELTVWGGDHRDSRIVITVPFSFKSDAKLATKVAARWLGRLQARVS